MESYCSQSLERNRWDKELCRAEFSELNHTQKKQHHTNLLSVEFSVSVDEEGDQPISQLLSSLVEQDVHFSTVQGDKVEIGCSPKNSQLSSLPTKLGNPLKSRENEQLCILLSFAGNVYLCKCW